MTGHAGRSALAARSILVLLATVVLAACDTGHSIVADNTTDTEVLARLSGTSWANESDRPFRPFSYVVIVPPKTRLVIAMQPFTGDTINLIEILSSGCGEIAKFISPEKGALFVISDGPRAEQREEYPAGSPTAQRTNACPGPQSSPPTPGAPSPTR